MGALAQAVQSGKALYVGLSNYDGETMSRAAAILEQLHCPFIINQNRYSILDRVSEKNGILSASEQLQKGVIIYSPLAQGMLTDRYLHGIPEDSRIRTDGRFLQESQLTEERLSQLRQLQAARLGLSMRRAQSGFPWHGSVRGYAHGKTSISSDLYAIIIVINISIACPQGAGKIMHMMLDIRRLKGVGTDAHVYLLQSFLFPAG